MISNNLKNASISELIAATKALKEEFDVYFPFSGASKCDLIINKNGKLSKIQVKKLWKDARGNRMCEIRHRSHNQKSKYDRIPYKKSEIDFLIAVEIETNDCWIIPISEILKNSSSISIEKRMEYKNNWKMIK